MCGTQSASKGERNFAMCARFKGFAEGEAPRGWVVVRWMAARPQRVGGGGARRDVRGQGHVLARPQRVALPLPKRIASHSG